MDFFNYRQDTLWVEDLRVEEILTHVGTPCYIYSQAALKTQWDAFRTTLLPQHHICYAVKANGHLAILDLLAQWGAGFDIVSGGELARVQQVQGNPKVVFSGVGKTRQELLEALNADIFCFNIESRQELFLLQELACQSQRIAPIALRINPHIDAHSHPYISTGLQESKFGIEPLEALALYKAAQRLPGIQIKGIACHIGSQLTTLEPLLEALDCLLDLVSQLAKHHIHLSHVDIGGGLGIAYQEETPPPPWAYIQALQGRLAAYPHLQLVIEPGRALVGASAILATQVIGLKTTSTRQFCIIDSGMNDLLRPALYQAYHPIIPLRLSEAPEQLYDVVGPVCESADSFGKQRKLAIQSGDYLAILKVGAYGSVMSSHYNARPRAAEIMVKGKEFKVIRARQRREALFEEECIW